MDELERFKREINLIEFAGARGYEVDRKESSRSAVVLRNPASDDKLVVRRDVDEHWTYFSVRDDSDRGSVIDFLQRRGVPNLGEARRELRSWLGLAQRPSPPLPSPASVELAPQARDRHAVVEGFARDTRLVQNSLYLNSRGIRRETLNTSRFAGTWRVDRRGNVIFPHVDADGLSGYEQKNRSFTGFAKGGVRALWQSRDLASDTRVVYVESAIDALSHYQLEPDPKTRYRSTGGALSAHQRELIAAQVKALAPNVAIVAAFDADEGGAKLSAELAALARGRAVERATPLGGKDWNDVLQRKERDYIRSITGPGRPSPAREL